MIDDQLRGLERAAREQPDDARAGWAYARGLARLGDRRGHFRELCRLARRGDLEAQLAVESTTPWPCAGGLGGTRRARRAGLRARAPSVRQRTLARRWDTAAAADDGALLVSGPEGIAAIDLERLDVRWEVAGPLPARTALFDRELLVVRGERWELYDTRDGGRVGDVTVRPLEAMTLHGDLVVGFAAGDLIGFTLDPLGGQLWRRARPSAPILAASSDLVFEWRAGSIETSRIESGRPAWSRPSPTGPDMTPMPFATTDGAGLVVGHGSEGRASGEERTALAFDAVAELDAQTGVRRWGLRCGLADAGRDVVLTDELAILRAEIVGEPRQLLAIERASGEVRWREPLAAADHGASMVPHGTTECLAAADDVLYLAVFWQSSSRIDVVGFDIATGERVLKASAPIETKRRPGMRRPECRELSVIPFAGGVAVYASLAFEAAAIVLS